MSASAIADRACWVERAAKILRPRRDMDRVKSMPRAYVPVMAIWSPFRNKPGCWPRHHSNLTAAWPGISPPEARKIMHFPKPSQHQDRSQSPS
jgi:hypothetical protein